MTTLKLTPRLEVEFAVAVRPPTLPVTVLLLSTSRPDMCPVLVPNWLARVVCPPGAFQALVLADLSAQ